MMVESFPWNNTCWGAVVFEKSVKQFHKNNFCLGDTKTILRDSPENIALWIFHFFFLKNLLT